MARREKIAEEMKAVIKPSETEPEPDEMVGDLLGIFTSLVPGTSKEGKALRKLLPQIHKQGLSLRALQAFEATHLFQVLHLIRKGEMDPTRGHIQISKITDQLRKLIEAELQPEETVPANIQVIATPADNGGAGDAIEVANPRDAGDLRDD